MKLGFSSYCFSDRLKPGSMDMRDALKWMALVGASHLEIATLSFSPPGQDVWWKLQDNRDLLELITASAQQNGVELSGICVPANFILDSVEEARARKGATAIVMNWIPRPAMAPPTSIVPALAPSTWSA